MATTTRPHARLVPAPRLSDRGRAVQPPGGGAGPAAPIAHGATSTRRRSARRWARRSRGSTSRDPLPEDVIAELRQALYDYKVIFFRDQPLTPQQHVAFAPPIRRPRDPSVPAVEHRRARAGALREDRRGQRLRELLAPRRHVARVPVDGSDPARRVACPSAAATRCSPTCTRPTRRWTRPPRRRSTTWWRCTTSRRRSGTA